MYGSWLIEKQFKFSAAHALRHLPQGHKCKRIHGHNYTVTVRVSSPEVNDDGMVIDYATISAVAKPLIESLDHQFLNDVMMGLRYTTAELMARWFCDKLTEALPQLHSVSVSETDGTLATYTPIRSNT